MSNDTTYCPPTDPPTAGGAQPRLPVRRRLELFCGAGLDDDDNDGDFLYRAAEAMERSHHEAKRRASQGPPPATATAAFRERQCICRRGPCKEVWKERDGRWGWAYECSAPPKCRYFAWCEESILNQNSQPAFRSHPEQSNTCAFSTPSRNHRVAATAPANVYLQGAGTTTPVNVSPQGAGNEVPVYVSPQGAGSIGAWPICKCNAGKCKILTIKGVDYFVCHIEKGKGACSYRVPVNSAAEEAQQPGNSNPREDKHLEYSPVKEANGHNLVKMGDNYKYGQVNLDQPEDEWPFDIVGDDIVPNIRLTAAVAAREPPRMPHKPISMVELGTPTKSPMPPATASPTTPRSNCCFQCGEEGHWSKNCPRSPCYSCGEVGHWCRDCSKSPSKPNTCFHCGEVGHWKNSCPVLRDKRGF